MLESEAAGQARGRLRAISVSAQKGVRKRNVPEADLKANHGIAGDAHAGVVAQVVRHGTLAGVVVTDRPPRRYEDVVAADHDAYARFFHAMLDRGVYLAPSGYEVLFTSLALDDEDLATIATAAEEAARAIVT